MSSPDGLKRLGWLPLVGAVAVMAVLVGLLWVNLSDAGQPEATSTAEPAPQETQEAQETVPTPPAPTEVAPEPTPSVVTPAGTTSAPDFQGIVRWLNSEPLSMEEQRGKVVLIDFWTYT